MFRKLSFLMLLVMFAILPTARAQVVNLVQNPSFEEDEAILDDPDWAQWTTWNPAEGAGSNATIVDTEAADGARSLFIEPIGAADWHFILLQDYIPIEVGASYTASFWAKAAEPRPLGVQFKASDNSDSWGYAGFDLTTEWAEYSLTADALNAETKLEFFCAGVEVALWLDNVSVYEEPEPLILNGSFEEDEVIQNDEDYEHWWSWGWEAGLASTVEIDESTSIDGTRSIRIEPVGGTNWFFIVAYSPILVELDKNYIISFWAKAEEPRPLTAQLKASDNSIGAWGATEFQLTTEWAMYSYQSEVQIDDVKLEFLCASSEVPFWLDFVSVYLEGEDPGIGPKGSAEAGAPIPADGAIDILRDVILSWKPGNDAVTHEVYFGTDFNDVNNADITDVTGIYRGSQDLGTASYTPVELPLEWDQTYYWRIDEINVDDPNSPWKGNVWSFTTTNHVVVDDFEDYDVGNKEIWWVWKDGLGHVAYDNELAYPGNGTGSAVGDENSPSYMEETIVHSGAKSMSVSYDNSTAGLSEVTRTLNADWTQDDVLTLTVFYRGKLSNDVEPMYIALNGIEINHDNPQAARASGWNQWDILLQDFADLGVDLTDVKTMTIGFGNKANPVPGGSGKVLIDDIRLYRSLPVEIEPLPEPVDPGTDNLVAAYSFENNAQDVSGNGLDGNIIGNPAFVEGITGMGLSFDGVNDLVDFGNNAAFDITEQITLSAWVNPNDAGNGQHNPYVSKGDQAYAIKHANSNTIEFFIYDSGWRTANVKVDSTFNGEWHHVLGTYDGNELKTYVDGVLGATVAHQGSIDIQTHNLTIAQNSQETDRYYDGAIDEVKIYDRALSAAEIRFLVGN
ncbi:LamG-like jellyroll fold domain-containing protein [Planctomycetota bacterium]